MAASLSIIRAGDGASVLPRAFDAEYIESSGLAVVEPVLQNAIHPAATGTATETAAEVIKVFCRAGSDDLDIAVFCVANPAAQLQLAGLTVNKPAETDTLYTAANEKVKHHKASVSEADCDAQEPDAAQERA